MGRFGVKPSRQLQRSPGEGVGTPTMYHEQQPAVRYPPNPEIKLKPADHIKSGVGLEGG